MDLELLRPLMTVILFCVFMCIVMWAWNGKQRERFGAAARLPLEDDDTAFERSGRRSGGSRQ
ncbi:MAG TPA: cbb3-type cytochrome c oxidase subunit 3 [Burkholderiales bacterium]|nr:cbb3-type cytochrome c oxidase subunit 3 [Burkholderiales bacterium]